MIVLGYDIGYKNQGLCVVSSLRSDDDKDIYLREYSRYLNTDYSSFSKALVVTYDTFNSVLDKYNPDLFVYEKPVFKRGNTGSLLDQVLGVVRLAMHQHSVPILPYTATEVKNTIYGKGKASKAEIEASVNKLLSKEYKFQTNHDCDACAVALTYFLKET